MDSTKTTKEIGVHDQERLPWEMVDEILSRVPPISLVRFRTVCKRWKALFNDSTFLNNHKSTFRFILTTESKLYSVSIDPKIVVCELTLDVPDIESQIKHLVDCNEFLLCCMDKGSVVWNPWLKQSRWIKANASQPNFQVWGIGYVNNNNNNNNMRAEERRYKTIGSNGTDQSEDSWWEINDFASDVRKDLELETSEGDKEAIIHSRSGVLLNGNFYWVGFYYKTDPLYHLLNFDFSKEEFSGVFCYLPCGMDHLLDALVLGVFREDRFSLLKQCHVTKKIEIWVTKNKVNIDNGGDVVWMNFMTLSIPNFPGLVPNVSSYTQPSFFIDDKRLVMCSCNEAGQPWIYVVEENKLISKVQLHSVVDPWPFHCTYSPSLVPVPVGPREEVLLQV